MRQAKTPTFDRLWEKGPRTFLRTCGRDVGPDLSLIGRTERRWIVESILQPSAVVAPHYVPWKVETTDGRTRLL